MAISIFESCLCVPILVLVLGNVQKIYQDSGMQLTKVFNFEKCLSVCFFVPVSPECWFMTLKLETNRYIGPPILSADI